MKIKIIEKQNLVAPLSVLSNWEKQIEEHCTPGTLSSCVYYGSNRGLSVAELQTYDVVITTYQTATGEHDALAAPAKKKRTVKSLFEMQWKVCSRTSLWIYPNKIRNLESYFG